MVRILYAERDASVRKAVARLLSTQDNFEVTEVENGMQALDLLLKGNKFDVLITGGKMPFINGRTLLARPEVMQIPTRILLSGAADVKEVSKKSGHWEVSKTGTHTGEALFGIINGTYKAASEPRRDSGGRQLD